MQAVEISDGIYWVGALDWNGRNFHGFATPRGTSYNAYLILDEKNVLIDGVKTPFLGEMMARVRSVIDPKEIGLDNNEIVLTNHQGTHHDKVLLLLPHCLQSSQCKIRVTGDIINCEECGACDISKLKAYSQQDRVHAAVASGGSMARKLIQDVQPSVIVAVACHRDLVEGTRDAWMLPVYAILNERPNGPCFETTVSMSTIDFAIKKFI